MGEYGYNIEHILMVDIIPDASVRRAMNEINAGNYFNVIFAIAHLLHIFWTRNIYNMRSRKDFLIMTIT